MDGVIDGIRFDAAVLRETGRLLRAVARSQDLVARCGGEAFAILLPQSGAMRGR